MIQLGQDSLHKTHHLISFSNEAYRAHSWEDTGKAVGVSDYSFHLICSLNICLFLKLNDFTTSSWACGGDGVDDIGVHREIVFVSFLVSLARSTLYKKTDPSSLIIRIKEVKLKEEERNDIPGKNIEVFEDDLEETARSRSHFENFPFHRLPVWSEASWLFVSRNALASVAQKESDWKGWNFAQKETSQ